ncbi:MAG: hypothetical protein IJM85_05920 [Clostridia bacterium]|nr:hypothetical protein [Clostridia bacterium]
MKSIYCRRSVSLLLALFALLLFAAPPLVRAEGRATTYNNTESASMFAYCDANGHVEISLSCTASSGISATIHAETYIEKRGFLGIFWTRVDIPPANDVWVDNTSSTTLTRTHEHDLNATGTYRVKTTFTVSAPGRTDDVIEKTSQFVY